MQMTSKSWKIFSRVMAINDYFSRMFAFREVIHCRSVRMFLLRSISEEESERKSLAREK